MRRQLKNLLKPYLKLGLNYFFQETDCQSRSAKRLSNIYGFVIVLLTTARMFILLVLLYRELVPSNLDRITINPRHVHLYLYKTIWKIEVLQIEFSTDEIGAQWNENHELTELSE